MIKIYRDRNRIVIEFPTEEDARVFLNFAKAFKEIDWVHKNTYTSLKITREDVEKYPTFLTHKPNKPIKDPETIRDLVSYLNKFVKCSNGIISPETIIRCIKNKHYVSALRNYLHMKYYYNEIPKELYNELLERIPKIRENTGLAQDRVPISWVLTSIAKARETKYYYIYIALYYSGGARLEQLLEALSTSKAKAIDKEIIKLAYRGKGTKISAYIYLPLEIYTRLEVPRAKPKSITRYFVIKKLVPVSLIRSFCWQTGKQLIGHDLTLLLQGRLGELKKKITARSYDDLAFQLDQKYHEWKDFVDELVRLSTKDIKAARIRAKRIIDKYHLLMPA